MSMEKTLTRQFSELVQIFIIIYATIKVLPSAIKIIMPLIIKIKI